MSPKKLRQFYDNGCASRCVIKLSEWQNKPIGREDFVKKFRGRFKHWKTQCGLIGVSGVIDICRSLKLCHNAEGFRCYDKIREILQSKKSTGMFLFTERDLDTAMSPLFHCSLIENYTSGAWHVWTPLRNGQDSQMVVPTDFLEKRLAHFLVLS